MPGSSVFGIFQARILEWASISYFRDLPNPGIKPVSPASPALQDDSLPAEPHTCGLICIPMSTCPCIPRRWCIYSGLYFSLFNAKS